MSRVRSVRGQILRTRELTSEHVRELTPEQCHGKARSHVLCGLTAEQCHGKRGRRDPMYYASSRRSSATGRRDPTCITRAHVGAVPRGGKTPRDLPQGSTPEGDFEVEMPWGGKTPREMPQGSTPGGNDIAKFREIQEVIERTCISMQRRLVGHILYRIEKAQKLLDACTLRKGSSPQSSRGSSRG